MPKFRATLQDRTGIVLPAATVTVFDAGTANLATIYSDQPMSEVVIGSVLTTDTNGEFEFFAPNGEYKYAFEKNGVVGEEDFVVIAAGSHNALSGLTVGDPHTQYDLTRVTNVSRYASVQAAIDAAPAGSALYFPEGLTVVSATLNVAKSLLITAAPGAVIDARLPLATEQYLFNCTANNVTFQGLTIDAANAPAGTLTIRHIYILNNGGDDFRVLDCQILNISRKGAHDTGSSGDDSLMSEYGIFSTGGDRAWIERNRITNASGYAIFIDLSNDVYIRENYISMVGGGEDSLGVIHTETACNGVWIEDNHLTGTAGGSRTFAGNIDIMSNTAATPPAVCKRVYIRGNLIESLGSYSSGSSCIRLLSADVFEISGNTLRALTDTISYVFVDARVVSGLPDQPGARNGLICSNILVAGAADQRGIDVRNSNATNTGGDNIVVKDNILQSDGTNFFCLGIRARNVTPGCRIEGNTVHYKYDATPETQPYGIIVTAQSGYTMEAPVIRGNYVEGYSVALSRAVDLSGLGTINRPIIAENYLRNTQRGISLDGTVANPNYHSNVMEGVTTPVNSIATGVVTARGNHFDQGVARSGTWTIASGTTNVTVPTVEAKAGDRVLLTVTTDTGNEKPVRVAVITANTGFNVKTMDGTTVAGDISGTWQIEH